MKEIKSLPDFICIACISPSLFHTEERCILFLNDTDMGHISSYSMADLVSYLQPILVTSEGSDRDGKIARFDAHAMIGLMLLRSHTNLSDELMVE